VALRARTEFCQAWSLQPAPDQGSPVHGRDHPVSTDLDIGSDLISILFAKAHERFKPHRHVLSDDKKFRTYRSLTAVEELDLRTAVRIDDTVSLSLISILSEIVMEISTESFAEEIRE